LTASTPPTCSDESPSPRTAAVPAAARATGRRRLESLGLLGECQAADLRCVVEGNGEQFRIGVTDVEGRIASPDQVLMRRHHRLLYESVASGHLLDRPAVSIRVLEGDETGDVERVALAVGTRGTLFEYYGPDVERIVQRATRSVSPRAEVIDSSD
jgi:hypothetical protein